MIRKFIIGLFAVGVVLFLVTGYLALQAHLNIEHQRALLDESGVVTDAKVFRKERINNSTLSAVGRSSAGRYRYRSNYLLHLRYDANSSKGTLSFNKALAGLEQDFDLTFDYKTIIASVGKSMYNQTKLGDTMPIKYLPDDPAIFQHLDDHGNYHKNYRLIYAILLFLLAGLTAILLRQYYKTGTTW